MSLKNPVIPPKIEPGTVLVVAQRLNHYATPGPLTQNRNYSETDNGRIKKTQVSRVTSKIEKIIKEWARNVSTYSTQIKQKSPHIPVYSNV
jgi:hypothetical protein